MTGKIEVELQEHMGSDASIANAAWCSTYDKDKREDKYDDPEKVAALVPRLIREGHSTPIESVIFRFWIRLPILIDREHMTHRIGSHNGLSGRYRTMPDDFLELPNDVLALLTKAGAKATGSIATGTLRTLEYNELCVAANSWYRKVVADAKGYLGAGNLTDVEFKRIRETVRGVLPIANMVERTTIFNLRSFANYYRLRSNPAAAKEIQEIANLMLAAVEKANVCPVAIAALKEVGWRI